MVEYWQALTAREKILIAIAGGLSVVVLLYFAAYRPLLDYRETSDKNLLAAERLYAQISRGAATLKAHRGERSSGGIEGEQRQPLRVSVATAARAVGVSISRIQPADGDGLTVWVERVTTNELNRWMLHMAAEYTITPHKVMAQKSATEGQLRVQLQFESNQ